MFTSFEKIVMVMAALRIFSGSIELFAAFLMLKFNSIEKALIVNSSLALVGPTILIITTAVGLSGIAEDVSFSKIFLIFLGITLILYGVKS
jgi:hypothetical protein